MTLLKTCIAIAAAGALLAAPPAGATRIYAGQPQQTTPWQMVLSVANNGKKVTGLTFYVNAPRPDGSGVQDNGKVLVVSHLPSVYAPGKHYLVASIRGSKLSVHIRGFDWANDTTGAVMDVTLTGTITKTGGTGVVKVKFSNVDTATNQMTPDAAATIHWKALRRPGTVYAGTSSQGEPVVLELVHSRKGVDHAHFTWYANSTQGNGWFISDRHDEFDMVPFPLSASGTFNRTYSWNFKDGTSGTEHFAGKVGKTKATGTFSSDWSIPSETPGGAPDTFSSGNVSWTALTG